MTSVGALCSLLVQLRWFLELRRLAPHQPSGPAAWSCAGPVATPLVSLILGGVSSIPHSNLNILIANLEFRRLSTTWSRAAIRSGVGRPFDRPVSCMAAPASLAIRVSTAHAVLYSYICAYCVISLSNRRGDRAGWGAASCRPPML